MFCFWKRSKRHCCFLWALGFFFKQFDKIFESLESFSFERDFGFKNIWDSIATSTLKKFERIFASRVSLILKSWKQSWELLLYSFWKTLNEPGLVFLKELEKPLGLLVFYFWKILEKSLLKEFKVVLGAPGLLFLKKIQRILRFLSSLSFERN